MTIINDPSKLEMPQGLSLLNGEKAICARGGCLPSSYWCRNCKLPPDFLAFLDTHQARDRHEVIVSGNRIKSFSEAELKKWRVVDANGKYIPYDANWVDSFPELKRITPFSQNYYDNTPTRSEKEFQEEIAKIKAAEPLQILNQVQHIEPEPVASETPIQGKSFIDKNKNYLIIGGIAITALILILVVRK